MMGQKIKTEHVRFFFSFAVDNVSISDLNRVKYFVPILLLKLDTICFPKLT